MKITNEEEILNLLNDKNVIKGLKSIETPYFKKLNKKWMKQAKKFLWKKNQKI